VRAARHTAGAQSRREIEEAFVHVLPAGYQNWRDLLFVHWRVATSELRALVPLSLEIDTYDGTAYVSLVAFRVESARPVGAPSSTGLHFLETNVRTYVRTDVGDPGVYFFSLDAGSLAAVLGARVTLGLPYFWATGDQRTRGRSVRYDLRRRGRRQPRCHAEYAVRDSVGPAVPGTLDHFLVERYILHLQRGAFLWSVRVQHQPYPLHAVEVARLEDELVSAAGLAEPDTAPLVHFASGVDVGVHPPHIRLAR
jgi:uncharacterized protein YqjF (DUF2071 family)